MAVRAVNMRREPDLDSEIMYVLSRGEKVNVVGKRGIVNGKRYVNFRGYENNHRVTASGWVTARALVPEPVEDYCGLFFKNQTGKRIQTCKFYRSTPSGYILPDETVKVFARAGDWALTSSGWTKWGWLTKCRDVFDAEALTILTYEVLKQAVIDYRRIITRLKKGRFDDNTQFCSLVIEMENIRSWFRGDMYRIMFDSVPGKERLKDLDEELGIDAKWLREMRYRFDEAIENLRELRYQKKIMQKAMYRRNNKKKRIAKKEPEKGGGMIINADGAD